MDWKRSANKQLYRKQLRLYKELLEQNYLLDGEPILVSRCIVVKMHPKLPGGLSVREIAMD